MKIDSHQHFWHYNPIKGAWITDEMKVIRRNFLPADLEPILKEQNFDGCVAVQADQSENENWFLLNLAKANPWIKGVVGWLDLKAGNLESRLEECQKHDQFKGIRHIIQAEPDGFMTDPEFIKGVSMVGSKGLTYDILTTENQLEEVVGFVKVLPEMKLVLDHISKPDIAASSFDHWATHMKLLAQFEQVHVKLSGMVTEANWDTWKTEDLKPYVDFCLEYFGPQRLMFGSDWPVCLVAGQYDQVVEALKSILSELSETEQNAIFGETACEFYKL